MTSAIILDERDTVAIRTSGAKVGQRPPGRGRALGAAVPAGRKTARQPIPAGGAILKFRQLIGYATAILAETPGIQGAENLLLDRACPARSRAARRSLCSSPAADRPSARSPRQPSSTPRMCAEAYCLCADGGVEMACICHVADHGR